MDLSDANMNELAKQLRKPEGEFGKKVGEELATFNAQGVEFMLRHAAVQPGERVLEIGFGPGESIALLTEAVGDGFIAGIDMSETMLEMATQKNKEAIERGVVELQLGTADALPYPDCSFDSVLSANVFHFWETPQEELKETMRVLKQGGRVVVFCPDPSAYPDGLAETGVFYGRTAKEVEKELQEAGFRNTKAHEMALPEEKKTFVILGIKASG